MELSQQICDALIADVKVRLMEESVPRIKQCLGYLTEEEIWRKPNKNTNSVGNLVLHLCGNVRQYVVSGIGGYADTRNRNFEFENRKPIAKARLCQLMDDLMRDVDKVLNNIVPTELIRVRPVQCFQQNAITILIHVTEHFSYHTGQITLYAKLLKNVDTKYYDGLDLEAKRGMG